MAERSSSPGMGRLFVFIAVFALIGIPIVGYLWETLNKVLALEATPKMVIIGLVGLAVFLAFLSILARMIARMHPSTHE